MLIDLPAVNPPEWLLNLLVPLGFTTFGACAQWLWRRVQVHRFGRAFGRNVTKHDSVAVVLSALYSACDEDGAITLRKKGPNNQLRAIQKADEFRLAADGDLTCGLEISSLFARYLKDGAKFQFDDEAITFQDRTVIFIGAPISNVFVNGLMSQLRSRGPEEACFDIETPTDVAEDQRIIDRQTGEAFGVTDTAEYAMIMRLLNNESKDGASYTFIVAGLTKFGTETAGHFLRSEWKRFAKADRRLASCGVVLETGRRIPGGYRTVVDRLSGDRSAPAAKKTQTQQATGPAPKSKAVANAE